MSTLLGYLAQAQDPSDAATLILKPASLMLAPGPAQSSAAWCRHALSQLSLAGINPDRAS